MEAYANDWTWPGLVSLVSYPCGVKLVSDKWLSIFGLDSQARKLKSHLLKPTRLKRDYRLCMKAEGDEEKKYVSSYKPRDRNAAKSRAEICIITVSP